MFVSFSTLLRLEWFLVSCIVKFYIEGFELQR